MSDRNPVHVHVHVLVLVLGLVGCAAGVRGRAVPAASWMDSGAVARQKGLLDARVAAAPRDAAALRDRGLFALMWLGDRPAAERDLEAALTLSPSDPLALTGAGILDHDALRIASARARFVRVLEAAGGIDKQVTREQAAWASLLAGFAADELGDLGGEVPGDGEAAQRLRALTTSGALSPDVLWDVAGTSIEYDKSQGHLGLAFETTRTRGCVRELTVSGALAGKTVAGLGALPVLDLIEPNAGDAPAASNVWTTVAKAPLCGIVVQPADGDQGVIAAETTLTARPGGPVEVLVVVDDNDRVPYALELAGTVMHLHSDPTRFLPRRMAVPVRVSGSVQLRLRVGSRGGSSLFRLGILDPATGRFPTGMTVGGPGGKGSAQAIGPADPFDGRVLVRRALADRVAAEPWLAPLAALMAGDAAVRSGDVDDDAALTALEQAGKHARFAAVSVLMAQLQLERQTVVGWASARDGARSQLLRAQALDPKAARPLLDLAQMDLEDENAREALSKLEAAAALAPASPRILVERSRALHERGFRREAEDALDEASKLFPGGCLVEKSLTVAAAEHHDSAGELAHAALVTTCDPLSPSLLRARRNRGDFAGATRELDRLRDAGLPADDLAIERSELELLQGDSKGAARELEAVVKHRPRDTSTRLSLVDALLASGDRKRGIEAIDEGLAEQPENGDLARAREALGEGGPMDAYRVDGAAVIRDFALSGRSYGAPAVILLDRTVVKVFKTGARLTLTHNVIRVQDKDGVTNWGEVHIPEGAQVIKLRTVKPDGSTREPEEIANKATVSAPDLQVGDYVEYEWIEADSGLRTFDGGFVGERFYFGTFDAPLDRTEIEMVTPASLDVRYDVRGNAPTPKVTRQGDEVHTLFADRGRPQLVAEVASVPNVEFIPSMRPYAKITWEAWRRMLRDQSYTLTRADRTVRAQAALLAGSEHDPAKVARTLYAWVVREIAASGGDAGSEPAMVLAQRSGSRVALLAAMAQARGIPVELLLARVRHLGDGPPNLPEVDEAQEPVLHLSLPGQDAYIDARFKHGAFGFLAPGLRGATALRLGGSDGSAGRGGVAPLKDGGRSWSKDLWSVLPAGSQPEDVRQIELALSFPKELGTAEIRAKEHLIGTSALEWREGLDAIPAQDLDKQFELRVLAYAFPGAAVEKLAIEGRSDIEKPLDLRYAFRAPELMRRTDSGLAFPVGLYASELGKSYIGVGTRTRPLQVDATPTQELTATVTLPPGVTVAGAPAPVSLKSPFGVYQQQVDAKQGAGSFTVHWKLTMPMRRVSLADYGDFVRFTQAVDAAQNREVALTAPRM